MSKFWTWAVTKPVVGWTLAFVFAGLWLLTAFGILRLF